MFDVQGLRFFLIGLRLAVGEGVGETVESGVAVATGLEMGNANVGDGEPEGFGDTLDEGEVVTVGVAAGLDIGLGVGEGGMIFSQRCNGALAPPISLTSVSQRA